VTFFSASAFVILFYLERYIFQNPTNVGSFSPLGFINNIGQVFNIWIPVFVLLIFNLRLRMRLIAIVMPILIALVSILMEASVRGSIIGLFAGEALVFTIMLRKDAKKAIFFLSTSLLLLLGIGSYKFFDALEDGNLSNKISAMENAISPSNGRLKLYANSFDMLLDNPLGVGSNNFEYIHPKYGRAGSDDSSPYINEHQILRTPHNIFLKFYTEQGFVGGTLFFLSLLARCLLATFNAFKGSFKDRWILVAVTATLFHSLLSAVFLTPGSLFFSIFIFTIVVKRFGTLRGLRSKLVIDFHPSLIIIPILLIGVSISSLASKYYSYQGSLLASPQLLSKSLHFNPYNERALYTLAHLEYRKNRDIEASLEAIDNFIQINPYHLAANYVKSERLFQMKRYSEADQTITQLLKIYPGYKKAQRLAKAIRRKLN
jgi:tetratricopeptide (TPR) repeat protein